MLICLFDPTLAICLIFRAAKLRKSLSEAIYTIKVHSFCLCFFVKVFRVCSAVQAFISLQKSHRHSSSCVIIWSVALSCLCCSMLAVDKDISKNIASLGLDNFFVLISNDISMNLSLFI